MDMIAGGYVKTGHFGLLVAFGGKQQHMARLWELDLPKWQNGVQPAYSLQNLTRGTKSNKRAHSVSKFRGSLPFGCPLNPLHKNILGFWVTGSPNTSKVSLTLLPMEVHVCLSLYLFFPPADSFSGLPDKPWGALGRLGGFRIPCKRLPNGQEVFGKGEKTWRRLLPSTQ